MTGTKVAPANVPTFAGIMLFVLGVFNVIDGFVLVRNGNWVEGSHYLTSTADTWGWILIVFAALQILAGIKLLTSGGGRTLAIVLASIGMFLWFALLFGQPFGALIGIGINFAIIATVLSSE